MQYSLDTSGFSYVSVMDAGLGVAAGGVVPMIAEHYLGQWAAAPDFVRENPTYVAAAIGAATCIPLYFWRGLGPAVIGVAAAIIYGLSGVIAGWLEAAPSIPGAVEGLRGGRAMGMLQATPAPRRMGLRWGTPKGMSGIQLARRGFQGARF